jgi:hypothetical protein
MKKSKKFKKKEKYPHFEDVSPTPLSDRHKRDLLPNIVASQKKPKVIRLTGKK